MLADGNIIETETKKQNVTKMWHDHFKHLLNSVNDT